MNSIAITNTKIYTKDKTIPVGSIIIKNSVIEDIIPFPLSTNVFVECDILIDGQELNASAGFIDQHVHGGGGADFMDEQDRFQSICEEHAKYGTTSLCATTFAADRQHMFTVLERISKYMSTDQKSGARIVGIHLEGPFLNSSMRGAHRQEFLETPTVRGFEVYQKHADGKIVICTLAPELVVGTSVLSSISNSNVVVSLGHTAAEMEDALWAFDQGASCVTHFFNAMVPFHHRRPGLFGAIMRDHRPYVELVAGGGLVGEIGWQLLSSIISTERIILVTDGLKAIGTDLETFEFSGNTLYVNGRSCYLRSGAVWGSLLTMIDAVKNISSLNTVSLHDALKMASFNPAQSLGLSTKGEIAVGKDADIVLFDRDFDVVATIAEGNIVYLNPGFSALTKCAVEHPHHQQLH